MQISNCLSSRKTCKGFTLIEVLVVLLIVTILFGLAVTRLPSVGGGDLILESRRLDRLLQMAKDEAMLSNTEYGFRTTDQSYEFLVFDDSEGRWNAARKPLHQRILPDRIALSIEVEESGYQEYSGDLPPVLMLSSGEVTPFKLEFFSRVTEEQITIAVDGYGRVTSNED